MYVRKYVSTYLHVEISWGSVSAGVLPRAVDSESSGEPPVKYKYKVYCTRNPILLYKYLTACIYTYFVIVVFFSFGSLDMHQVR